MSFFEAYKFLSRGGWLMLPIAICSIAALAFFLERLWALRRSRILPDSFIERLFELLEAEEFEKATELCRQTTSPLGAMVAPAIGKAGEDRAHLKEIVEEEGQREVFYLERFVNALGAIATISPLLGLLGTVVGMIDVFQDVVAQSTANGQVQAAQLASGIWQALITTASGLTVAIPVYLGYRYILSRVDQYAVDLGEYGQQALDYLADGERPAPSPARTDADREGEAPDVDSDEEGMEDEVAGPEVADEPTEGVA